MSTITRRAALVGTAAPSVAIAAASVPALARFQDQDHELIELVRQYEASAALANQKWDIAEPVAMAVFDGMAAEGLSLDAHLDLMRERMDASGATELQDDAAAATDIASDQVERIMASRPNTAAGVAAKLRAYCIFVGITDDVPRHDQDIDQEFINILADDLGRLAAGHPKTA
jgi:hypothetical protein